MASSLRSQGGNRFNLGDVPGACAAWRRTIGIYTSLQRGGALSETDRKNGLPNVRSLIANICEGDRPAGRWPKQL
jgi:hypothetical protein